jgi:cytoskeletal protein CcmA (bactofilin family)
MLKDKRGSTLVLALLLFAFVMIIGTGTILLTSVSSEQTTNTLGDQQAEFSARSVLDAVISKIRDGQIDPEDTKTIGVPITGSGEDEILGSYVFSIDQYIQGDTEDLYKVSVSAEYQGYSAQVYSILQKFGGGGSPQDTRYFNVLVKSTAYGEAGVELSNAHIKGNMILKNAGQTMKLSGGGDATGNLEIEGNLEANAYTLGTQGENNAIYVTGNVLLKGGAKAYASINSLQNVSLYGGASSIGDVTCNGNVIIDSGYVLEGSIYTNGDVTISGGSQVTGDIYANGSVTIDSNLTLKGSIYAGGDVNVVGTVTGSVISNGDVNVTGNVYEGISALGDLQLESCSNVSSVTANGSIYLSGSTITVDVVAGGSITVGKNKTGGGWGCTVNGALSAGGDIFEYNSSVINGPIRAVGNVTVDSNAYQNGSVTANGNLSVVNGGYFKGDVHVRGDFNLTKNAQGNVVCGGRASIAYATLSGSLWVRGNGYFVHWWNTKNVTGVIYLGGTLEAGSSDYGVYGNNIQKVDPNSITLADPVVQDPPLTAAALPVEVPATSFNVTVESPAWEIPVDTLAEMAQNQITMDLSKSTGANYTVSGNYYTINQNCFLEITGYKWDKKIVLDASEQDLYVLLKVDSSDKHAGNTVTISNGVDILSKGPYNVFIFLDDGQGNYVNLDVGANSYVGLYDNQYGVSNPDTHTPNLYIISNEPSAVLFEAYNTLYGYIYAPWGTASLTNSSMFGANKLYGAVTASKITFSNNLSYLFYPTNLTENNGGGDGGGNNGDDTGDAESWARLGTYFGSGEE